MNIWILKEGEPLPIGNSHGRIMRAGMLAKLFSNKGADVIWWSSTYLHYEKRYVSDQEQTITINPNFELKLLHSTNGYKKNISVKRVRYSNDLGNMFRIQSRQEEKPDIIYCSWPLMDFAYESVKYGQKHSIPVVIDVRDFWPDIFIQPFPKVIQPLVRLGIQFIFNKKVSYVMENASVVVGVIPKALNFAASHGRTLQSHDHIVRLAYDNSSVTQEEINQASKFWTNFRLSKKQCIVSYIGTISNRIGDFDTLVEAAQKCVDTSILFVFCGTGNYFDVLKERCRGMKNVILPGYLNKAEIQFLLRASTFGLLAYRNTIDFVDSLPNKFGEYLSQGLIILTSLKGTSRKILEEKYCGAYYHDATSLLDCINQINQNKIERERMSKNALELYHQEFDASRVYMDFYRFLEELVSASKDKG